MIEKIKTLIVKNFGDESIRSEDTECLQPSLNIKTELIADVCLLLRDHPETYFDFLSCLSAVDYGVDNQMFGVVYHLASIPFKTQLTLKVEVENSRDLQDLPKVPTVSTVWKSADWHEREAYDLMGIIFIDHPDMRRILLPDDWEGYPLRKDYQTAEYYKGIKIDY